MNFLPVATFRTMPTDDQTDFICWYGNIIMQTDFNKNYSLLYSVEDFYVEIILAKQSGKVLLVKTYTLDELLNQYLNLINISSIYNVL